MEEYQGSQQIIIQSHLGKATSVDSLRMVRHKLGKIHRYTSIIELFDYTLYLQT